ncbi:hypothetical protein ACL2XP_14905 [Sodalis sp. RH21]|uniref:hypothetical protein n=1 Tax=unclassified Sodalis (in: enterobacteria) TaxID=2636512 RepID=UPI0039B48509
MSASLQNPPSVQFREPNTAYLSPAGVGDFFDFRIQELAERAHVHRNPPSSRPQAQQLQQYLVDLVRVLAVATEMTGGAQQAVFLIRNEPLRAFGYKTADALLRDGRADDIIAYLESLAGGAAG